MPLVKFSAINIALYVFISLNPYIRWILPNEVFYFFFIFTTIILTNLINNNIKNGIVYNTNKKQIAFILLIFIAYFTTPIFHDLRWGHLLWQLPFLMIIFYNDIIIQDAYKYLKKIMVWVAIFSLTLWILNIFNIPLPYYSYYPDFRYDTSDYYRIYGLAISLYSGDLAVGGIYGIERITGVFAEPGHFGIYLGLLLSIDKFNITKRDNQILLITGILTFSSAFYAIVFFGFLYRFIQEKKISKNIVYPIIIIIIISIIGSSIAGEGFKELVYGRVLKGEHIENNTLTSVIDSRVTERFMIDFNKFSKTPEVIAGKGYFDQGRESTTNWRGLILRFGIIGLSIIILLFFVIVRQTDALFALILFSIGLLILAHRSYLLYTPAIYILLFIASSKYKLEQLQAKYFK